ncbi:phosphatase PAP2 family protein [Catelliglobosispora koreensis]|uniref:phosphatase PAP2 family protein n=1 Tax=Catelliglobosispora koreensis TaxID=129052 RepID=UPI00036A8C52|nr:phosphatase PAP2 family protein [Catelliglobosispora koreensis]
MLWKFRAEAAYAAAFALITVSAAKGWTASADLAVADWCAQHQQIVIEWIAIVLNKLGQGWLVMVLLSGGLTAWLLYKTRKLIVAAPMALAFALTYFTTGPLKLWSERDAPSSTLPNRVEFFNDAAAYSLSYPSGHVVNAIVWWGVIEILLNRQLTWLRIAAPAIVLCTTTYLGHHWLTDGLGALTLGLLLDRIIHRVKWDAVLPR